jgi:hypothetical protein|tara:strand:+ start:16518 stop:16994 length:477 start_codon:yes stop_codon:yes gene_type:complete
MKFKELREKYRGKFPSALVSAAVKIALDMGGNMTGAYKKIENMKKGLGNDPMVKDALRLANEDVQKEELTFEALSDADKKKRLAMIKKAVEKISKSNAEKAKKDALRMMKDSGMFDEEVNEVKAKDMEKVVDLYNKLMDVKHGGPEYKKIKKEIDSLK